MNEDKSARYHRLRRRAGIASAVTTGLLLAGLLATGTSAAVAAAVRAVAPSPVLSVVLCAALLAALHEAAIFPVIRYRTFVLERRYGLSDEAFRAWLRDYAVASAIRVVLAVAASHVVYVLLRHAPRWWWLAAAAIFAGAAALLAKLAPVLILPLFYTLRPLSREPLRDRLAALSARAGVPVLGVYEWEMGRRTRRGSAALVGTGRTRRILVSDTMLDLYSEDEIEVVLAHELAHHVHSDIFTALLAESVLILLACFGAACALGLGWRGAGLESSSDAGGLPLLALGGWVVSLSAAPLLNALSRRNERRADRYALALTGQPAAFISAMRRLAAQNLAEEDPPRAALWLFHTHPPIAERIDTARRYRPPGDGG